MRNGRTSGKRRATIVSSVMPRPPKICMLRSTTRQIASEQMTLAMLDSCVPRWPWSRTPAMCQITRRLWWMSIALSASMKPTPSCLPPPPGRAAIMPLTEQRERLFYHKEIATMSLPTALSHPCYHDDDDARLVFEEIQWPHGPVCPHCGLAETVARLGGKSMGPGWYWCSQCREKFTVRVGSVMERSHIPMHKWLLAFRLMNSSKKGMSAHQLHRMLGVTYRSAWFMAHRIRFAQDASHKTEN